MVGMDHSLLEGVLSGRYLFAIRNTTAFSRIEKRCSIAIDKGNNQSYAPESRKV